MPNASRRPYGLVALLAIAGLSLGGCGAKEELGPVSGRVSSHGEPVTNAIIKFHEFSRGIHIQAELDEQGRYEVGMAAGMGLPLGTYQVAVVPKIELPPISVQLSAAEIDKRLNPQRKDLPKKYWDEKTSELVVEVKSGQNDYDIELAE